jgi:outer membrane protein
MKSKQKGFAALLLAGFIFAVSLVNAQDRKLISLTEAIDLGIKNSKQLKISQAKTDEATAALKEAVQKKLPNAGISGSYLRLSTANIDLKTKNNNGGSNPPPTVSQAMYGMLNVSLPIYAGSRIKYGIESNRFLEQAAKLDVNVDRAEIIQNTIEAFINLYKSKEAVNLVKQNLTEAQQRVIEFTNLEKNGVLARNDLLKAELQSSNTESSLLDAENNWQLANFNMNLMLGLPEKTELIPDSSSIEQTFNLASVDEYVQSAIKNRQDLASLALRKKAAESAVKATKGEYYPNLSLTGGYIAADVPNLLTVSNAVNIGVGVSYNIASLWKTKVKVQQAESRAKQLEASEGMLNDNVRLQVNRVYLNLLSSQKKIQVYQKAVELAEENYKIVKNKYNNNLATAVDLLDADTDQLQAHLNYVFAKADAVVAYNKLLQASGLTESGTKK